ncbi:hypothetical protein DAEQUDRAFT_427406 [Daedalea quercina L-15889]|uniref:Uncharacterized protein n=1 Tax=Daedalea quercina L-15889 TaxID=1314783 RepID=A0A165NJ00_9APHY|nr:hypothetical protein DAEQUDRAFT_427406 [Daedalea quercina L-15889]
MAIGKGGWRPCKNKAIKKLVERGETNIVTRISGSFYYMGTYIIVDDPVRLTTDDFRRLPQPVQNSLVTGALGGQKEAAPEILSSYENGAHTALKYPFRRVGFDEALDRHLRSHTGGVQF